MKQIKKRRKDPYENVKLYEQLSQLGLNDFELVKVLAQEAKRINQEAINKGKLLKEKPTTLAMKNLINGKVKYTLGDE